MANDKSALQSAFEAWKKSDIKTFKSKIKEALLTKAKARLDEKEKEVAKSYFTSIDKINE